MKRSVLLLLAASALAGCGEKKGGAPSGQVAANVGGQEITTSDVRLEMGGIANDPQAAAAAQPAALQAVVNRKLLAAEAKRRGIDKTPVSAMQLARAQDLALIQMLQQSIVAGVPKPTAQEANIYVQQNPASFAGRKLVSVDQILVPRITPALLKQLEPLERLEQITALLDSNKVPYRAGGAVVDTATLPAEPAKQIGQMSNGFVFLTPAGGGVQVSRVSNSRPAPLTGNDATLAAQQILYNRRVSEQLKSQFESIIKAGQPTVQTNPAFKAPTPQASSRPTP